MCHLPSSLLAEVLLIPCPSRWSIMARLSFNTVGLSLGLFALSHIMSATSQITALFPPLGKLGPVFLTVGVLERFSGAGVAVIGCNVRPSFRFNVVILVGSIGVLSNATHIILFSSSSVTLPLTERLLVFNKIASSSRLLNIFKELVASSPI